MVFARAILNSFLIKILITKKLNILAANKTSYTHLIKDLKLYQSVGMRIGFIYVVLVL